MDLEKLKYPVGKFVAPTEYTKSDMNKWMEEIESLPFLCRNELRDFTEEMLNEPYRPGGWTARQVIHHIADSHINAYIRIKLAITEDTPVIKPYYEDRWAQLKDTLNASPEISLNLLDALHNRLVLLLKNMSQSDFERTYYHPESKSEVKLKTVLALYAWHGRHHLEHIRNVKRKFATANA
jgi:hypothetical protein